MARQHGARHALSKYLGHCIITERIGQGGLEHCYHSEEGQAHKATHLWAHGDMASHLAIQS